MLKDSPLSHATNRHAVSSNAYAAPRFPAIVEMPTILRSGPYRFFFYSSDGGEPPHVHVQRDEAEAKFWLDPLRLERSGGFPRSELHRIRSIIADNRQHFLDAWDEYFR